MPQSNKRFFSPQQKLEIVMESFQRDTTIEAVCRKFGLVRSVIHRWRDEFRNRAVDVFVDKRSPKQKALLAGFEPGESPEELKKIIGNLTVQLEIVKKAQGLLGFK
jgi:transposase